MRWQLQGTVKTTYNFGLFQKLSSSYLTSFVRQEILLHSLKN